MTSTSFSETKFTAGGHHCELTLATVLASGIEAGGSQEIITYGGLRLTYQDLNTRFRRLGYALMQLGVKHATRIAVLERDTHRYLESYFAIPMLGATLMTVNIRLSVDQIRYTLEHSQSEFIIAAAEFMPLLEQVFASADRVPPIIVIGESDSSTLPCVGEYEALLDAAENAFEFPYVSEDSVATHFYTTGTTGLPKGVTYTHRQLVAHTLAVGFALGTADDYQAFRRSDVYMPLTPMFHVHAWGLPYVATLLGVKQVYPGKYDAQALVDLVHTEGVTFSHCVPTVLQMLLTEAEKKSQKLPGWKVMVGGSAMSPALAKRAMASDLQVFTGYGMSETCPVISFVRTSAAQAAASPENLCRIGHPMPLVTLKIDLQEDSHQGELVARSVWLTQEYHNDPAMSEQLWEGQFLHTGDVVVKDADGAFRLVDRTKDVIKSGGEWLSSLDLEACLAEHPNVDEVAVIAIANEKWGERPCAFVKLKQHVNEPDTMVNEMHAIVKERIKEGKLPPYAMPDEIRFVDELPRTSVGKLNKKLLRENIQ
ncbi:MAG: long-chain-fatty-acid--CoA ligase [Advenella sp.]|uniref:Long-chain fatty acid--CoA ligase n=1 Tax=Advenella kashmirensis TaxID=310575 RepID=A0A356LEH0_9BURK|nr:long-chain-fatty-acid--CoA ligase [Advenella sp. FME57]HBP29312.1 long-chain fatty acid--CoA ligase [Advenella kashmirensis]